MFTLLQHHTPKCLALAKRVECWALIYAKKYARFGGGAESAVFVDEAHFRAGFGFMKTLSTDDSNDRRLVADAPNVLRLAARSIVRTVFLLGVLSAGTGLTACLPSSSSSRSEVVLGTAESFAVSLAKR